ncbi:alpha/beta fold hydrolase [Streptomyces sp. NPDC006265]|uniref:thioesterase II family protein n=1 Tax=Streptomyces sp. NPDC006265 TaxID=3156740 RepID=UPI0033BE449F
MLLLPHSGASAQSFASWARWFPEDIRLAAAQYPGHGSRYEGPVAPDLASLADDLARQVAGTDGPLFVFGHSFGALVGFEICWRLEREGRAPAAFFASAAVPPHQQFPAATSPRDLTDDELLDLLSAYGAMPKGMTEHPEALHLALRLCRADMALADDYTYGPEPRRLTAPMVVLGGDRDPMVSCEVLHRWQELTTGPSEVQVFAGGHFYLHDHMHSVTGILRRHLQGIQ